MEARVAQLETHIEYIRRDLGEVRGDVKTVKSRISYFAGGAAVVTAFLVWVAHNRFDQIMAALAG